MTRTIAGNDPGSKAVTNTVLYYELHCILCDRRLYTSKTVVRPMCTTCLVDLANGIGVPIRGNWKTL